jgi:excisionase family DNA binding protein
MLAKPCRPREKRIVELTRVTHTIAEFCETTGLSRAAVLRLIDSGSLRSVKVGTRRLIFAPKPLPCCQQVHNPRSEGSTAEPSV